MQMTPNAEQVLRDRYYRPGDTSPEDVFRRVATAVARGEEKYGEDPRIWADVFYNRLFEPLLFLPNSPTIANAGTGSGCLSACFVISPGDTMESIMDTTRHWAMVEKWGGGVGASFDRIRPRGATISTVHGKALGPVGVMRMLSTNAAEITQGAFRLGAHMGMLSVTHPDIRDFIHCKDIERLDPQTDLVLWMRAMMLQNFNISVKVTDMFMYAVDRGEDITLTFEKDNGEVIDAGTVSARELWDEICTSAWTTGDPGIAFIDRIRATEPNPHLGLIQSSNPCGEEWLEDFGSCNLGSVDLGKHLIAESQPGSDQSWWAIDWEKLRITTRLATRFLNDVTEINQFPLPEIAERNKATLRIGLGVMGWADMLMRLGVPYDSDEAYQLARKVGKFFMDTAWDESAQLAEKRGPYPEYERSALKKRRENSNLPPVRNSSVITIAPTGTISLLAGCSSGIEPYFAVAWKRKALWTDQEHSALELVEAPPPLREKLASLEVDVERVLRDVAESEDGGKQVLAEYLGTDYTAFRTAMDMEPRAHIWMQAAWQENVTNSVSKTINMPNSATVADVSEAYKLAWATGCKCVTIYRDGSKRLQVLNVGGKKKEEAEVQSEPTQPVERRVVRPRPRILQGFTQRVKTPDGAMYVHVTVDEHGEPFEVFGTLGKAGEQVHALQEAVNRMVSTALRAGVPKEEVVDQLGGIVSGLVWDEGRPVTSAPDGIALVIQEHFMQQRLPLSGREEHRVVDVTTVESTRPEYLRLPADIDQCEKCHSTNVKMQEGCITCLDCHHSKCD